MIAFLQPVLGITVFVFIAWILSENRDRFPWRVVLSGLLLQFLLAVLLIRVDAFKSVFLHLNDLLLVLDEATRTGSAFVFGYLGGGQLPFEEKAPGNSFIIAFRVLPLILVISALSALLFHWKVLPLLIRAFSWLLDKAMGIKGALGLTSAANIFVGMLEAPLLVRPFLMAMSRSELFAMMSTGMATIAGTMMVIYGQVLSPVLDNAIGHILAASIISAPAALLLSLTMLPADSGPDESSGFEFRSQWNSSMEAVTDGTLQGVQILLNVMAMLIVLLALIYLANALLGLLPDVNNSPLSLQRILGFLFAPFMWLLGIPWNEAHAAGSLMGIKTISNEFIAYMELAGLPDSELTARSKLIMTYALCGFANLGSLGIMIGGLSILVPEKKAILIRLGGKSLLCGTMATMMTGCVVAILL